MDQSVDNEDGWGPPVGEQASPVQPTGGTQQDNSQLQSLFRQATTMANQGGPGENDDAAQAWLQSQMQSHGAQVTSEDEGWGPDLGKAPLLSSDQINQPTKVDTPLQMAGMAITDTVKGQADTLGQALSTTYNRIKFRTQNPNLPAQEMTPDELSAAKLLGYSPASMTGAGAQSTNIQPSATGQGSGYYFYARAPKLPSDYGRMDSAPSTSTIENPLVSIPTKSLPSNFLQFLANAPIQQEYQYQQIHKVLDMQHIAGSPDKYSPQQVSAAKKYLAALPGQDKKTTLQYMKDVAQQFQDHPKEMGIGLINSLTTDPEMLVGGMPEITAISDAAKAAGVSAKSISAIRRVENAVHGAITGGTFGGATEAGQQISSESGNISPAQLLRATATGAAIGGALGASRSTSLPHVAGGDKLEPDPMEPGWSEPVTPQIEGPAGGGQKLLTQEEVPGEMTTTAQRRLGSPGDVNQIHKPGEPIPTNAPLDDTGHVPYTGGTSEDLKGLHVDKTFPNTLSIKNVEGKEITVPVKDIVTQVHEAEEAPLMHPQGPVPIDKIYDLIDRAGNYATTEVFSPAILKKIADGTPLDYQDAHEIATAIENHHVETNYNIDPKVYQEAMKPYIKEIARRSEDIPKSEIPATLGNKPYEDMGHPEVVEGQDKPSVGGLPESLIENNASGESSASLEAINRFRDERAAGRDRYLINRDGSITPLMMTDDVDRVSRPGQVIVQKGIGKDPWTILSHGDDVSPEVAKGKVNAASAKLAQAGRIDPRRLYALGAASIGALAGAYIYKKHPVKGALEGAGIALALRGVHPVKFLNAMKGAISGDKRINISNFLNTRDGMLADSSRARMQAQNHLATIIPTKQERVNVDNHLDDPKRYPKLTPKEQEAANYIRNVYNSLGKVAMSHGVLDEMIQDYNARRWQRGPNTDKILASILAQKQKASATGTTSTHNLNRVFVTKAEGKAAGLTPVTEDAIANLGMYWDSMVRTIANKLTLDSLKKTKIPGTENTLVMSALKAPPDYVGNARLPGLRVHPDIAQAMSQVYFLHDTNPFISGLQAINTLQKRTAVMGSLFHVVNMAQAHYSANPITTPIKNTKDILSSLFGKSRAHQLLKTGGPQDELGLLLRGGMKIQLPEADGIDIDYNQSYYPALNAVQGYLNTVLPGSGKLVGGLEKVSKLSDKFIFTNAHAGFKMSTALTALSKLKMNWALAQQKNPNLIIPNDEHLAGQVASYVNNVYGGLDWRRAAEEAQTELGRMLTYAAYGPVGRALMSFAFFAPDWLMSTMRAAGKSLGTGSYLRRLSGTGTPEEMLRHVGGSGLKGIVRPRTSTDLHRQYQIRNAVYFFMIASALNYYFSGHGLTENKNPLRVDMGHGEYMEYNKHGTEAFNALENPRQFFLNKLGFIPREAAEWALNKDYLNVSGHAPPYSGLGQHALNTFTPFTISNMVNKSPRDIALNLMGLPVYGINDQEKALHRRQAAERLKEQRREDPSAYREKRREAAERRRQGD